ncbi:CGLD27 family protein [Spirulina major CS-329]|uniref:CGLD27 family protein n=1 Tax=Spirulina TaxID=1154 RepID=UPI00232BE383|nr:MULTISPECIES: CGLD27 family protein [Spirulina]MDB9493556.1 CGLD27 family protein [Spirulina subsalsa CS-330]MDB9503868.1 CGLD27 family protein [Spirulina major CS-329]
MSSQPSTRCPVPEEQQPLNEYEQLREAWLFNWTVQSRFVYVRKLFWVWAWSWVIAGPTAAASFRPERLPLQFALAASGGALVIVVLLLLRLYLGWLYIRDRLSQTEVVYEESGWYDGQRWQKTDEVLMRDRLVVSYQVQPILQRLQTTFLWIALSILGGSALWFVADTHL